MCGTAAQAMATQITSLREEANNALLTIEGNLKTLAGKRALGASYVNALQIERNVMRLILMLIVAIAAMNISGQVARTPARHMIEHFLPRLQDASAQISHMLLMKA